MTEYLSFKNVTYSYGAKTALKDVSFSVNKGDYLCILGENGTGKSTIVKLLLGLLAPDSGTITLNGASKGEIGYLPQTTVIDDNFPASVYEVVLQGRCEKLGRRFFYSSEDKNIALENIRRLDIEKIKNISFTSLSGGQKQRVLLARALCAAEKILVLDEPVSGLDPIVTEEMYSMIERLNREEGISVILVSHDTKSAAKYATHILHIKKEVLFYGSAEEYEKTELYHEFLGGCGHEHH
ncbi:MAG: metal ABC transporter ATP-binding protein [Clostridia bacterium]|nr:metal ABC transporter ATP-binding protein [Clostridia bacterium]